MRQPPNTPARNDAVKLRGRNDARRGVLVKMDHETFWCTVEWAGDSGPRMCHLFELEASNSSPVQAHKHP